MKNLKGLYVITPDGFDVGRLSRLKERPDWCALQYRDKNQDIDTALRNATALSRICASWNIPFIVNDSIDLALEVGADGVHLGESDEGIASARERMGSGIVGCSCYNVKERALSAVSAGADYISFGAFYPTPTKPHAPTAGVDLLGWVESDSRFAAVNVFAIGGIEPEHCQQVVDHGADGVCVVRGVLGSEDIIKSSKAYLKNLGQNLKL